MNALTRSLRLRPPLIPQQTVRSFATKKTGGTANRNNDSAGRRLGIKVWSNQMAYPGNIIVRQRGQIFRCGENTYMGKDHTIHAKVEGKVMMEKLTTKKGKRKLVHVVDPDYWYQEQLKKHAAAQLRRQRKIHMHKLCGMDLEVPRVF